MTTIEKGEIANLSREEKIQLLEKIKNGEAFIINGAFIDTGGSGIIFFDPAGKFFLDNDCKHEVSEGFVEKRANKETLIFLPVSSLQNSNAGFKGEIPETVKRITENFEAGSKNKVDLAPEDLQNTKNT